jgi:hypothetical protein
MRQGQHHSGKHPARRGDRLCRGGGWACFAAHTGTHLAIACRAGFPARGRTRGTPPPYRGGCACAGVRGDRWTAARANARRRDGSILVRQCLTRSGAFLDEATRASSRLSRYKQHRAADTWGVHLLDAAGTMQSCGVFVSRRRASVMGSVSARASKYSWLNEGRDFSGGLQHPQNRCGAAKEVEPAVVGGDLLIGSGAGTEKVA